MPALPQPMKRVPRRRSRESGATPTPRKRRQSASGAILSSEQAAETQSYSHPRGSDIQWQPSVEPFNLPQAHAQQMPVLGPQGPIAMLQPPAPMDAQQHQRPQNLLSHWHRQAAGGLEPIYTQASAPKPAGPRPSFRPGQTVQQPRHSQQQQQQQRALDHRYREAVARDVPVSDASDYQLPLLDDHGFALPRRQHSDGTGQQRQAMHSRQPPTQEPHEVRPLDREELMHSVIQHGSPERSCQQLHQRSARHHDQMRGPGPGAVPGMMEHRAPQQHLQDKQSIRGLVTGSQMLSRLRQPAVQGHIEWPALQDVSMAPAGTYQDPMQPHTADSAPARLGATVQRDSRRGGGIVGQVVREAQQSSHKPSPVFRAEEFRPSVVQVI